MSVTGIDFDIVPLIFLFNFGIAMIVWYFGFFIILTVQMGWRERSCGCDRMVVGFTTTYAVSAYHH